MVGAAVVFIALGVAYPLARAGGGERGPGDKDAKHVADQALETKILGLETKRIAAMVSKDIAALDALLADDLTYTHSGGTTDTKSSFIALIKERGRYLGVDYSNTQVVPFPGGTAVAVRGRAQIRLVGVASYSVLFLDVWALRDGAWKMVAWQATRVP
jgi:ketosteroid isomerase-like protein